MRGFKKFHIAVNPLKSELFSFLNKEKIEGMHPYGYCHFPKKYTEEHIKQFCSEKRVQTFSKTSGKARYGYKLIGGRRNEALDCRVYNLGSLYILKYIWAEETGDILHWTDFWDLAKSKSDHGY